MGKLETTMKDEMGRLARKEIRKAVVPLKKEVVRLKKRVIELSRSQSDLAKQAKASANRRKQETVVSSITDEKASAARISPDLVKKLRQRLGVSQSQLASLIGVSGPAVAAWEQHRAKPAGDNRKTLLMLRGLGKREVSNLLRAKLEEKASVQKPAGKTRGKKRARRKARSSK